MPRLARLSFRRQGRGAFTLLEMCIVLFIIVLLLGVTAPSIQSAFVEQQMRGDAREVALMIKTAMQQSLHEHRGSTLILTPKSVTLDSTGTEKLPTDEPAPITHELLASNRIFFPDPETSKWTSAPEQSWVFEAGELCPVPRLRLVHGAAWLEMSFNPLTGNVENEASSVP